jgi:pSer/pThr/pTyr-binding forkhead associated (FHA) protein
MSRAVVESGGTRQVLDGPRATIGRSDDADCVLRDPNISRIHAELHQGSGGEWEIVDLNSTNGIKVNGRRVSSARLRDGDQVTAGTTTFRFSVER